jgi:hypothetical protein
LPPGPPGVCLYGGDASTATRGMVLRDRDNPNRYYAVIEDVIDVMET